MKILAISGSSRDKHTNYMLRKVLGGMGENNFHEFIMLKDKNIQSCRNCKGCHKSYKCVVQDDMQEIYPKLLEADIILLGSPTYFDNVSGLMKNFMDRCLPFYFSRELKNKPVGLVSVGGFKELIEYDENGNCKWCQDGDACNDTVNKCLNSMEFFCTILEMKVTGKVAAIHGSPEVRETELIELGEKLIRNIK